MRAAFKAEEEMEALTISSCEDDTKLTFSSLDGDIFRAEISSIAIRAQIMVTALFGEGFRRLIDYFESMQKEWRGWDGVREWTSAEGECNLSATSDWLGHVLVRVSFKPISIRWSTSAMLVLDVSQIDELTRQLRKFFEVG